MKFLVAASISSDIFSNVRVDTAADKPVIDADAVSLGPLDKQVLSRALSICPDTAVASVCPMHQERVLRYAVAMGAKSVFMINDYPLDAYVAAIRFSEFLKSHPADVVLCGEASWDYATGDFPKYLAALTGVGLLENVSDFSLSPQGELLAVCQTDDRQLSLKVKTPVILSCNKSVFPQEEVRIPSMREMMLSLRAPLQVFGCEGSLEPRKIFRHYRLTPLRAPVRFVAPDDYALLADIFSNSNQTTDIQSERRNIVLFSGRIEAEVSGEEKPVFPIAETEILDYQEMPSHRSLKTASIVIAGGMGVDVVGWELVDRLAEKIGAAVGCTRPVYQSGRRPYFEHIGQTGAKVAPQLYVAVGISGALQHIAGIVRSKKILAINTDPQAEIFKYADYGIEGDANKILSGFCSWMNIPVQ